jgi:short-subunit dehydrogenase involved in D-alanine esterification of teichoic acids
MQTNQHSVLITGGATGIGLAIARKFHAAGNRVILVGRSQAMLEQAASALPGVEICSADVAVAADRERLVRDYPGIDVLVNNAGMQVNGNIIDLQPADIEREMSVNFLAPVLLSQAFLPLLLRRPAAAIINVSSGLALTPKQDASIYCASKAALHSHSQSLRWQLENTPVRVFEVLPPLVDTAMTAGRGKGKISPEQLAEEFWSGFCNDRFEMLIGKCKLLAAMLRLAPKRAARIIRPGV